MSMPGDVLKNRTHEQMLRTLEDVHRAGLDEHGWCVRAKKDPKGERGLQEALVRHHRVFGERAQRRLDILDGKLTLTDLIGG